MSTRISGPDGPLILAVDLRNTPKWGGVVTDGRTHGPTHCFIYIDDPIFRINYIYYLTKSCNQIEEDKEYGRNSKCLQRTDRNDEDDMARYCQSQQNLSRQK